MQVGQAVQTVQQGLVCAGQCAATPSDLGKICSLTSLTGSLRNKPQITDAVHYSYLEGGDGRLH